MKENSLHQGSNQGPLACLAEMLTNTPSELVERLRSDQHLYYIFEYCPFYFIFSKTAACMVAWQPIFRPIFFSAEFFSAKFFFRPNFFFGQIFFQTNIFFRPIFFLFSAKFFFRPKFFRPNFFFINFFLLVFLLFLPIYPLEFFVFA